MLNGHYGDLRLIMNFSAPPAKLIAKERDGAKVRNRSDTPTSPIPAARRPDRARRA